MSFRWLRLALWLGLLLLAGGYAWLCFYGVPDFVKDRVIQELAARSIAFSFRSIHLEIPTGIVAHDVTLGDMRTPDQPLVRAQRVGIKFDLLRLWWHRSPLDALELMNGDLSVPLFFDDPHSERIEAHQIYGRIRLGENNVLLVDRLTAEMLRLRLALTGQLTLPTVSKPKPPPTAEERERRTQLVRRIAAELRSLQFQQAPVLSLEFKANADDMVGTEASLTIQSGPVSHPKVALDALHARVDYHGQKLRLEQFDATLGGGTLALSNGSYDFQHNEARVTLRSTADWKALATFAPPKLQEQLAEWRCNPPPRVVLTAGYAADRLSVEKLTVEVAGGAMTVENGFFDFKAMTAGAQVRSDVDAKQLTPFLPPGWRRMLRDWTWAANPKLEFEISWTHTDPQHPTIEHGRVAVSDATFRGIPILRAVCRGVLRNDVVTLTDGLADLKPSAERPGEITTLQGNYACHLTKQEFVFSEMSSNAETLRLAPLLSTNFVKTLREFRTDRPSVLTAGRWIGNWLHLENSECEGHLETGPLVWHQLSANATLSDFRYGHNVLLFRNATVRRPEGDLHGSYQYNFKTADFGGSANGPLDLVALKPALSESSQQALDLYRPETPVMLDLKSYSGNMRHPDCAAADGSVAIGKLATGLGRAANIHARFTLDPAAVHAPRFSFEVPSGKVEGRFDFDRPQQRLELSCEPCKVLPVEVAQLLGSNAMAAVSPYRFATPPKLTQVKGTIHLKDTRQTVCSATIAAPGVDWWRLHIGAFSMELSMSNQVLSATNFVANFYNGRLQNGQASFDLKESPMHYQTSIRLENVRDGGALLKAMFGYTNVTGSIQADARASGVWGVDDSIQAGGDIHIVGSRLWTIPIFGALSTQLGMLFPNRFTNPPATDIDTTFRVADGCVYLPANQDGSETITVKASPHSMTGRGSWKIHGDLDFVVKPHIMSEGGLLLFPVTTVMDPLTKPFEMELTGPLSNPQWRLRWLKIPGTK